MATLLAVAICASAAPAAAVQVSSASTAALGMAENFTAAARGVDAVAWNPAVLAFPHERGSSLVLLTLRASSGLGPVGLGDLAAYANTLVPDPVKREWLDRIADGGGQQGSGGGDVTWLALRKGRFALHASTAARALADVSPGVAELVLFGNVGPSGQPRELDLSGSRVDMLAWSAVGASYAYPLEVRGRQAAIGVTAKFIMGHAMALGERSTGSATTDPVSVTADFPIVHTPVEAQDFSINNGLGVGLDLGGTLVDGDWTFAAVIRNLINTFRWDESRLAYRPLTLSFDRNSTDARVDAVPLVSAPVDVQQQVADLGFRPSLALGAAWQYAPDLLFTADLRLAGDGGLHADPPRHLGLGAEYMVTDWLPVRLGGAVLSIPGAGTGWQLGGGLGLAIGGYDVSFGALRRDSGRFGPSTVLMLSLFGSGR